VTGQDVRDGAGPEPGTALDPRPDPSAPASPQSASEAAAQAFLQDLGCQATVSRQYLSDRISEVRQREKVLFLSVAIASCAAPLLVVIGTVLIVSGVAAAGGALLTAAGLLGGASIRSLRRLQREASAELTRLGHVREYDIRLYQGWVIAQQITDPPEKAAALRELAAAAAAGGPGRELPPSGGRAR
jgi:hypothetical protein